MRKILKYKKFLESRKSEVDIESTLQSVNDPMIRDVVDVIKKQGKFNEIVKNAIKDAWKVIKNTSLSTLFITIIVLALSTSCNMDSSVANNEVGILIDDSNNLDIDDVKGDDIEGGGDDDDDDEYDDSWIDEIEEDENGFKEFMYNVDLADISRLSKQFGVPERLILLASGKDYFESDDDVVKIPKIDKNQNIIHKVAKGETLYGLSKRYKLTKDDIKRANGLESDDIIKGSDLIIPVTFKFTVGKIKDDGNWYPYKGTFIKGDHYPDDDEFELSPYGIPKGMTMDEFKKSDHISDKRRKIKNPIIFKGSHFPDDPIKSNLGMNIYNHEKNYSSEIKKEYLPTLYKLTKDEPTGLVLLAFAMAWQEGFYSGTAAHNSNNPGNIGNTDDRRENKKFRTLEEGILYQLNKLKRVAIDGSKNYPLGKKVVLSGYWSSELHSNWKKHMNPSDKYFTAPITPGYEFIYTGQLDQFLKIYATGARVSNNYISTVLSIFKANGYDITPDMNIKYIISLNKDDSYLVKSGDNLNSISKEFGISLGRLKEFNGLKSNNIKAGDVLKIPNASRIGINAKEILNK